jgi:hypothetical protein
MITVTPIFGDNMSPTGFRSVPCERLEVILDGERLNCSTGRAVAIGVPTPNCGRGRGAAAPARLRPGRGAGFNRNAVPKMLVRFKTTPVCMRSG